MASIAGTFELYVVASNHRSAPLDELALLPRPPRPLERSKVFLDNHRLEHIDRIACVDEFDQVLHGSFIQITAGR